MKRARFLKEARSEFLDQVAHYELIERGRGERFRSSVQAAVVLATTIPLAGAPWKFGTRRVFPKRFPFSIVYRLEPETINIVAVAHFRRKPTYWRSRQGDSRRPPWWRQTNDLSPAPSKLLGSGRIGGASRARSLESWALPCPRRKIRSGGTPNPFNTPVSQLSGCAAYANDDRAAEQA